MGNKISSSHSKTSRFLHLPHMHSSKRKKTQSPSLSRSKSTSTKATSHASSNGSMSESIVRQGRMFHNVSDSIYWLPSDDDEMDRLVGQHFALKALFGGSNVAKEVLPILTEGAKILDVGCGPGTWIMDLATEYPECELVGIDMCDVFPASIRPPNVQFLHANVLERLPFDDNTFDFVNMRFFMLALRCDEWPIVLKEVYRILKPGGYFQSLESGMLDHGNDFCLWVGGVFANVMQERGQEPYIAFKLGPIMEEAQLTPLKCDRRIVYLSKPDQLNREFLWDVINIIRGTQPFLTGPLGVSPEKYPQFLRKFEHECKQAPGAEWEIAINLGQKAY